MQSENNRYFLLIRTNSNQWIGFIGVWQAHRYSIHSRSPTTAIDEITNFPLNPETFSISDDGRLFFYVFFVVVVFFLVEQFELVRHCICIKRKQPETIRTYANEIQWHRRPLLLLLLLRTKITNLTSLCQSNTNLFICCWRLCYVCVCVLSHLGCIHCAAPYRR